MSHVVVLGAGLGGAGVVARLGRRLASRQGVRVTVVEAASEGVVLPLLPFVAAGVIPPAAARVDLRRMGRHARLARLEATQVDTGAKRVAARDPASGRESEISYDHLVVALGGAVHDGGVPGVRSYALAVRTTADATTLHRRVTEVDRGRPPQRIAVVGGGQAGIAIASLLAGSIRNTAVTLLDRRPRLLSPFGPGVGTAVASSLASAGVDWRPDSLVAEVGPESLLLRDGTELPCSVVVWAAGQRSAPAVEPAFPDAEITAGGRLVTDPMLRVRGVPDVWACGDCASVPWLDVGGDCPPAGTFTRAQAVRIAMNIERVLRGEEPRSFRRDVPVLVPVGRREAVGSYRGRPLSGAVGALAWAVSLGGVRWPCLGGHRPSSPEPDTSTTTMLPRAGGATSDTSTPVALGAPRRRPT